MSNNSTQRYLDNERQSGFLSSLLPTDIIHSHPTIVPIPEEIDIDRDIEKNRVCTSKKIKILKRVV